MEYTRPTRAAGSKKYLPGLLSAAGRKGRGGNLPRSPSATRQTAGRHQAHRCHWCCYLVRNGGRVSLPVWADHAAALRGALMRSADVVPAGGLSPRAAAGHSGETGLKTRSSPGLPLPGLLARKSTLFFLFSLFFSSLPLSFLPSFLIFILNLYE